MTPRSAAESNGGNGKQNGRQEIPGPGNQSLRVHARLQRRPKIGSAGHVSHDDNHHQRDAISRPGSREFGTRRSTIRAAISTRANKVRLTIHARGTCDWLKAPVAKMS